MRRKKSVNNLFYYQIHLIFITEDCNPKGVPRYKPSQPSFMLQTQSKSSECLIRAISGQLIKMQREPGLLAGRGKDISKRPLKQIIVSVEQLTPASGCPREELYRWRVSRWSICHRVGRRLSNSGEVFLSSLQEDWDCLLLQPQNTPLIAGPMS